MGETRTRYNWGMPNKALLTDEPFGLAAERQGVSQANMNLPQHWELVNEETGSRLVRELRRELPPSHPLCGLTLRAVAHRVGRDDVLFVPTESSQPVYLMHLSWNIETDPRWPWTRSFANMEEFLAEWPTLED